MGRLGHRVKIGLIILSASALLSCGHVHVPTPPMPQAGAPGHEGTASPGTPPSTAPQAGHGAAGLGLPSGSLLRPKSRWIAVDWSELPGWDQDALDQAWPAQLRSCQRPHPAFASLCPDIRRLASAGPAAQRRWMMQNLRPYRVEAASGESEGLLTSYFEPVLQARRQRSPSHAVALHRPPADLASRRPWYTRQEIDTLEAARSALSGREIAWLADPIDAMVLHIQGSGRLLLTESDGSQRQVRVAFAGSNDQPYRSINQWLLEQGVQRISPWPEATKAWAAENPQRLNALLWSNPRYVFFREEPITDPEAGPRGAQGVPLSAGRSIAVDPGSIPYGTPVWLASRGPAIALQRLVVAQDTGAAIVGAVRADYFAGTGPQAGALASQVKQPLQLWALWPR